MMTVHNIILLVVVALIIDEVKGFTFGQKKSATTPKTKSSPFLEEALASYPYVFKSDQDKAECIANFNEIARLYGDKEAVEMCKVEALALTFNRENFAPCLESWEEQFGLESAQGMVQRNPGLLGVRPAQTGNAEASMAISYVIAAVRQPLFKVAFAFAILYAFTPGVRPELLDNYREIIESS